MTVFDVLPLAGAIWGLIGGATFGARFGVLAAVSAAIAGAVVGFMLGRVPFVLVLRSIRMGYRGKTVEELRGLLRDPGFLAPNTVLLELRSRGVDLEQELPVVLDMLAADSRERRIRGWHALSSAFPKRAEQIADYRLNDKPEECRSKTQKLREAEPGAPPNGGPTERLGNSGVGGGPPSVS